MKTNTLNNKIHDTSIAIHMNHMRGTRTLLISSVVRLKCVYRDAKARAALRHEHGIVAVSLLQAFVIFSVYSLKLSYNSPPYASVSTQDDRIRTRNPESRTSWMPPKAPMAPYSRQTKNKIKRCKQQSGSEETDQIASQSAVVGSYIDYRAGAT